MPIVGMPSPPGFPPPDGTKWTLQRNVLIYDGSGQAPSGIPATAASEITYEFGTNYGYPGQSDNNGYAIAALNFLRVDVYLDADLFETMAVDWVPTHESPNNPAEAVYVKIDGGDITHETDLRVGAGFAWPRNFDVTYTVTIDAPPGVLVGVWPYALYGDMWVALPASSKLSQLNPSSPGLDPEKSGLELTWVRKNTRVPRQQIAFGKVGGFTWPSMWDDEKRFMLDGQHLRVDVNRDGGYTIQSEWYFIRIPGDPENTASPPPGESGLAHVARFDEDNFDDLGAYFE